MPRIPGTTNAQTKFLRSFIKNSNDCTPHSWPAPAVLRRWLRRPGFIHAMESLKQAIRFQSDFQLILSAAQAATEVERSVLDQDPNNEQARQIAALSNLLKLAHTRERFAPPPPPPPQEVGENVLLRLMRTIYRDSTVADVLDRVDRLENCFRVERLNDELNARADANGWSR
jgi:hypothetical protein